MTNTAYWNTDDNLGRSWRPVVTLRETAAVAAVSERDEVGVLICALLEALQPFPEARDATVAAIRKYDLPLEGSA